MLRATLGLVVGLWLTGIVIAGGEAADSAAPATASRAAPPSQSEALEIMRDHVRSQMDWRSYFSNRMDVRRSAQSATEQLRSQPGTASTVQTR